MQTVATMEPVAIQIVFARRDARYENAVAARSRNGAQNSISDSLWLCFLIKPGLSAMNEKKGRALSSAKSNREVRSAKRCFAVFVKPN